MLSFEGVAGAVTSTVGLGNPAAAAVLKITVLMIRSLGQLPATIRDAASRANADDEGDT